MIGQIIYATVYDEHTSTTKNGLFVVIDKVLVSGTKCNSNSITQEQKHQYVVRDTEANKNTGRYMVYTCFPKDIISIDL